MNHNYIKTTSLGTITSKFKEYADGRCAVWIILNGNEIYKGDFHCRAAAESWFITHGYELIK